MHGPSGSRRWVFLYKRDGKRREMGLGSESTVSLAEARRKRDEARRQLAEGSDPIAERDRTRKPTAPAVSPTFGHALAEYVAKHEASWKNEVHKRQWRNDMPRLMPGFCAIPVSEIEVEHVASALEPIWLTKSETAQRNRERMERVLDYAKMKKWRAGENPAKLRANLEFLLPKISKRPKQHGSIDFREMPEFIQTIRSKLDVSSLMLEFTCLTALRTAPVLSAKWADFDFERRVWSITAVDMKADYPHRVPLTPRMLEIIAIMRPISAQTPWLFINRRKRTPMSDGAMLRRMKTLGYSDSTVHGLRASFRTWLRNCTAFKEELGELALSHQVADEVVRAYLSDDALEERRPIMEAWEGYITQREL